MFVFYSTVGGDGGLLWNSRVGAVFGECACVCAYVRGGGRPVALNGLIIMVYFIIIVVVVRRRRRRCTRKRVVWTSARTGGDGRCCSSKPPSVFTHPTHTCARQTRLNQTRSNLWWSCMWYNNYYTPSVFSVYCVQRYYNALTPIGDMYLRNNRYIQSGRRYLQTGIDIVNCRLDFLYNINMYSKVE